MHTTKAAFVGRITTSSDASNAAFRVKLYITDSTLDILSATGDEWSWNLEDVTITRTSVERFHLQLSNEELFFLPVDTLGFTHSIVDLHSEDSTGSQRGWLRRRIEAAQASGDAISGYDLEVDPQPLAESQDSGRKRHVHEWTEGSAVGVITRRCIRCGQVSIDATGVKSELESTLITA